MGPNLKQPKGHAGCQEHDTDRPERCRPDKSSELAKELLFLFRHSPRLLMAVPSQVGA